MHKIEPLIEQTTFLLEKQKESKDVCEKIFADLLELIDQKAKTAKVAEDARSLEKIYSLITEQAQGLKKETQEDLDFLQEQLKMFEQLQGMADKAKADEILRMTVEDIDEVQDLEEFKKGVLEEAQLSKQNLLVMVEDIKAALNEGSAEEVAAVLEAIITEQKDQCDCDPCACDDEDCFCDDEEDDEDNESADEASSCGSCCGCSKSNKKNSCCDDGCGVGNDDIFTKFNTLADKKTKK